MQLQQLQIFHNLTEEELKKSLVCSQATVRKYKKNEYIFQQGDAPKKLYFVLEGEIELGSINLNGKVTRISRVTVGEEFGEVEMFLRQSAYSGYARAKKEVSVLEVSQSFFGGRCERNCVHHSKVVFNMLQLFAEKADKHNHQIEVLTSGNLRQRVAAYLLENSNSDYRVKLQMNREDLAAYLNTTRPSLSRMLLNLQEEGIIQIVNRKVIEILDYDRLQEEGLIFRGKYIFAESTDWTYPVFRQIFKSCPRFDSVVRISDSRIIFIATWFTYIFFHS